MSLQIQDITSQHLAAVNNIISTIQSKLAEILIKFEKYGITIGKQKISSNNVHKYSKLTEVSNLHREIAFDNNDYIKNENTEKIQSDIDNIFANSGNIKKL